MKPRIVISGVNFVEAGPLSVFRDALEQLADSYAEDYEIIALVHSRTLFKTKNVTYLEYPLIKSSWLRRLSFEYWHCLALSRRLKPYLWLAMHDMTPNVHAERRAVYCHNPAPFRSLRVSEMWKDPKFAAFTVLYRYLYAFNLHRNDLIIVQQQWLREEFRRQFGATRTIVAHPSVTNLRLTSGAAQQGFVRRLFYPAFPRLFKNMEVVLEAMRLIEQRGVAGLEVWLTVDGSENAYAAGLRSRYADVKGVRWLGRVSRERVVELIAEADCLIFPSRLETWGMPISEFKQTGKPMMLADLPYAHETAGRYAAVHFFAPQDAAALADDLEQYAAGRLLFRATDPPLPQAPYAADWAELFRYLLQLEPA